MLICLRPGRAGATFAIRRQRLKLNKPRCGVALPLVSKNMAQNKQIAQQIQKTRLLINGALRQPVVSQKLAKFGFPKPEIKKGEAILNKVELLQLDKTARYGQQLSASEHCKRDRAAAWEQYNYHVKSAKLVFRNDLAQQKHLQLNQPRQRSLAAWLTQARYFYQEIRQMLDHFAKMGVTADELAQAQAMIEAVAEAQINCKTLVGEAQMATQQRNVALKELNAWVRRFTKVARIALEENDQLLEGLGLLVRSKG